MPSPTKMVLSRAVSSFTSYRRFGAKEVPKRSECWGIRATQLLHEIEKPHGARRTPGPGCGGEPESRLAFSNQFLSALTAAFQRSYDGRKRREAEGTSIEPKLNGLWLRAVACLFSVESRGYVCPLARQDGLGVFFPLSRSPGSVRLNEKRNRHLFSCCRDEGLRVQTTTTKRSRPYGSV